MSLHRSVVTVANTKSKAATVWGELGGVKAEVMPDSGSSVSLVRKQMLSGITEFECFNSSAMHLKLVTASGAELPVLGHIRSSIRIGEIELLHTFAVVESLVASVILGIDFLHENGLVLDFTQTPVQVRQATVGSCSITPLLETPVDAVDECAVPDFGRLPVWNCQNLWDQISQPFWNSIRTCSRQSQVQQRSPSTGNPVRVLPRCIPAQYREEVQKQLEEMLDQGIIEESSSPWMAPAVYVQKKSGELRMCVDYRELNKQTAKDAYLLPLPDEVQDKLAQSKIFSTLDLKSGYWQLPVHPEDCMKTSFCPGPGLELYQFCRMPPSSFQRLMDKVLRGPSFATTYVDDILVHSASEEEHNDHLRQVLQRLREAGLTLKG